MRTITKLVPFALFGVATWLQACGSVKYDGGSANQFPPKGVIRGTFTYAGSAPCSQNGHIVGNAIILVFDRRNPPPPAGLGNTPANFGVVSGDVLFRDWPRTPDATMRCPDPSQVLTTSAPFSIAPMDAGSYIIQAFYDYTGNFLPTFKLRNTPEASDVGGGYIDIADANKLVNDYSVTVGKDAQGNTLYAQIHKQDDPNFQPTFLPVEIGIRGSVPAGSLRGVPTYTMPPEGFLVDNVAVAVGARLPRTRPYFYPEGVVYPVVDSKGNPLTNSSVKTYGSSDTIPDNPTATPENPGADPAYQPVLTFPASIPIYAQPTQAAAVQVTKGGPDVVNQYQASFPQLRLNFGVPTGERSVAVSTDPANPFHMQLDAASGGNGGVYVWWDGNHHDNLLDDIPETTLVHKMWPLVVLTKLVRDPTHSRDPQGLTVQGSDGKAPVVIIQGITLAGDSLLQMAQGNNSCIADSQGAGCSTYPPTNPLVQISPKPTKDNLQDHVTVLVRPSAVCFDPAHIDLGGHLVTPHLTGPYPPADTYDIPNDGINSAPTVNPSVFSNPQIASLISGYDEKCIPPGRYGINVVAPTGQAWSTPNEAGHCAASEGVTTLVKGGVGGCGLKPRPVLTSQGTRAVIEVLDDPTYCHDGKHDVPDYCATP